MKRLVWILCLVLFACSSSETDEMINVIETDNSKSKILEYVEANDSNSNQRVVVLDDGFIKGYNRFTNSIKTKNGTITDEFISPNGMYLISSQGALPSIEKIYSSEKLFFHDALKIFLKQDLALPTQDPIFDTLPKVICDENVYDKQGCFVQEINPLLESQIWNYASLNEKEIQAIEFLAETVKMTVINTSNFIFYFSEIEGKWYLTFLDLRVPCQA